jgi:hypothetical protein
MNVSKKTYIEFLNENFSVVGKMVRPNKNCPDKFHRDLMLGGIPRVLILNEEQYLPVSGMTLQQMFKAWYKQAPKRNVYSELV